MTANAPTRDPVLFEQALPDVPIDSSRLPFSLRVGGLEPARLHVERFTGREAVSKLFSFDVVARITRASAPENPLSWLEAPALLSLATTAGRRRIHGMVARVRVLGSTSHGDEAVKIRIVPRLARLSLRKNSRVFQDKTPQEIASAILDEAGISHRWEVTHPYPRRVYATQYEETDLGFLQRIVAEVGIFYRFEAPLDAEVTAAETIVFADSARYEPIASPSAVAFRARAASGSLSGMEESITAFALTRRTAPECCVRRTYDFRRPRLVLENEAPARPATRDEPASAQGGAYAAEWFEHDGEPEPGMHELKDIDARIAQLRRKTGLAEGHSTCRRLAPGHAFSLAGHETPGFDGRYAVAAIHHEGRTAEHAGKGPLYENTFWCVRASEVLRPRRPRRIVRHVLETATVVGPAGSEIHADDLGRVRVRFPWDRSGTADERASCWIRTAQLWSGNKWGAQFVPRVGMEVLVGFLQGDPDQPVILGCVPNAVCPLPFEEPTKSGFRSRSTPGGKLRNEIVFEDRKDAEEMVLSAGRDLVVTAGRHATMSAGGSHSMQVLGTAEERVGGERIAHVGGNDELTAGGDAAHRVAGGWTRSAGGAIVESAGSSFTLSVGRDYAATIWGAASTTVGAPDAPATASLSVNGDHITDATGAVRIVADQGVSLACGDNRIDITKDGVRIVAARVDLVGKDGTTIAGKGPSMSLGEAFEVTAGKVRLFAEQGQLLLDKEARLNGERVKLNCSDEKAPPEKEDGTPVDLVPFTTKLTDPDFSPYASKTYHLVADGLRYEGTTTAQGVVDKQIPKDAKAIEITVWPGNYPEGERRTFHIRLGDKGADTIEGAQARLANLGYLKGALSGTMDEATRAALMSFQADAGLPATGALDSATAEKLASVAGG